MSLQKFSTTRGRRMKTTTLALLTILLIVASGFSDTARSQELRLSGEQFAQNSCCNCDPHDSDMQCFMECNADLPRCQAPAPRPPALQRPAYTPYCCAGGRKVSLYRRGRPVSRYVVGGPCSVTYALITVSGQGCFNPS